MVIVIEASSRAQFLRILADLSGSGMEPGMKDAFVRGWLGGTTVAQLPIVPMSEAAD